MKKIPTITIVLCVVSVGVLSGCISDELSWSKPSEVLSRQYEVGDKVPVRGYCKGVYGTGMPPCPSTYVVLWDSINEPESELWTYYPCDFQYRDKIDEGKTIYLTIQNMGGEGPGQWEIIYVK